MMASSPDAAGMRRPSPNLSRQRFAARGRPRQQGAARRGAKVQCGEKGRSRTPGISKPGALQGDLISQPQ